MLSTLNGEEPTNKITFYLPRQKNKRARSPSSFSPLFCFGYTPSRACPPLLPFTKNMKLFIAGYYYYYCYSLARWILSFFFLLFSSPFAAPTFPAKPEDCVTCVIRLVSPVSTTFHQALPLLTPKHSRRLFGFSHFWVGTSGALCVCPYPPIN